MAAFQEGDVVRLKSGSPPMTVAGWLTPADQVGKAELVICHWIDAAENLHEGRFTPGQLVTSSSDGTLKP